LASSDTPCGVVSIPILRVGVQRFHQGSAIDAGKGFNSHTARGSSMEKMIENILQ